MIAPRFLRTSDMHFAGRYIINLSPISPSLATFYADKDFNIFHFDGSSNRLVKVVMEGDTFKAGHGEQRFYFTRAGIRNAITASEYMRARHHAETTPPITRTPQITDVAVCVSRGINERGSIVAHVENGKLIIDEDPAIHVTWPSLKNECEIRALKHPDTTFVTLAIIAAATFEGMKWE